MKSREEKPAHLSAAVLREYVQWWTNEEARNLESLTKLTGRPSRQPTSPPKKMENLAMPELPSDDWRNLLTEVSAQQQTMNFYYSWEDGFSTDPDWSRSADLVILCDGLVVTNVLACLAGPNGFLKILRETSDGRFVLTSQKEPAFQIRFGHVEVQKRPKEEKTT